MPPARIDIDGTSSSLINRIDGSTEGAIPLSLESIMRAIEINGAAVDMNKQAFGWGGLAAHDISRVRSVTQLRARATSTTRSSVSPA